MNYQAIDYQGGQIYVDKEAKIEIGDTYYNTDYKYVKTCIEVSKESINRVIYFQKGSTVFDYSVDCFKIVAQSPNLSLEGIPYVKIEEDGRQLAHDHVHKFWSQFPMYTEAYDLLESCIEEDIQMYMAGYKAASAKKYTEKQVRGLVVSVTEFMSHHEPDEFNEWFERKLKSFQPKVASIEVEVENEMEDDWKSDDGWTSTRESGNKIPVTYTKNGKTFLKVKKVNYE